MERHIKACHLAETLYNYNPRERTPCHGPLQGSVGQQNFTVVDTWPQFESPEFLDTTPNTPQEDTRARSTAASSEASEALDLSSTSRLMSQGVTVPASEALQCTVDPRDLEDFLNAFPNTPTPSSNAATEISLAQTGCSDQQTSTPQQVPLHTPENSQTYSGVNNIKTPLPLEIEAFPQSSIQGQPSTAFKETISQSSKPPIQDIIPLLQRNPGN